MNTSESITLLNKIGEIISSNISGKWKEINVEAEIDDELADLCVWVIDDSGNEHYPEVNSELTYSFIELRKISNTEEKGYWSKCMYKLLPSGKYSTEFSYEKPRWA